MPLESLGSLIGEQAQGARTAASAAMVQQADSNLFSALGSNWMGALGGVWSGLGSSTGVMTMSSGTLPNVTITMEEVMRAAESIPPRQRGANLNIPLYSQLPTHYAAALEPDVAPRLDTLSMPWQYVYDYQVASQVQPVVTFTETVTAMQDAYNYPIYMNTMWDRPFQYSTNVFNITVGSGFGQTPEEIAEYQKQCEKEEIKRKAAEVRAEELLIACLSPEQIKQYQQNGYFEADVNDKKYRIKKGRSGNVYLIEAGKPKYKYCAHPSTWTPDQDVMLSQLLMLQTNEQKFLSTANRTQLM